MTWFIFISYETNQRWKPSYLEEHHTIFPILMLYVWEQFAELYQGAHHFWLDIFLLRGNSTKDGNQ